MKRIILLSALLAAGIANATQPNNGNNGGDGGNGYGGSGVGIGIAGASVKNSTSVRNNIRTTNVNANISANENRNTANGGAGGLGGQGGAGGNASNGGNTTGNQSVTIEGAQPGSGSGNGVYSTVYERSAPGVAVGAPTQPLTSCRLSVSLGGSSAGGAGAGGIPIGNDETCLAAARLALMDRVGGFTSEDKQRTVCKVEGMAETSVCKSLDKPAPTASVPAAPVASSTASDPFIAMSGRTYPSGAYANK